MGAVVETRGREILKRDAVNQRGHKNQQNMHHRRNGHKEYASNFVNLDVDLSDFAYFEPSWSVLDHDIWDAPESSPEHEIL